MMKINKLKLIISTIVVLLPILFGLILWDKLPEQVPTHWGADGNPDGWSSKAVAVFVLPCVLAVLNCVTVTVTSNKQISGDQSPKVMGITYWLVPAVSLFANGMTYAYALGREVDIMFILPASLGLMLIVVGNYLPKCRQSRTVGIRIKWTLEDEENWNATHRFGGKVWVSAGILSITCVFLPDFLIFWVPFAITMIAATAPIVYSYVYYRKYRNK
ncbi:MAG: DUF1648 domain-containing protein [Clostridia bacterium]|nr:DUF1648 domain-containing protein [Clostridia bacterium]